MDDSVSDNDTDLCSQNSIVLARTSKIYLAILNSFISNEEKRL